MHIWTSFFCWGFFFTFYFLSFSSFCFFHKYVILKVKWNAQYACSFICHRKSEPHFFQKNYNIISHFKDLERGKKWPHGNLMKFSKWKWKVLLPGEECLSQDRLGTSWVESSFAKEDLRISVEKKEVRQWCASIRACIRKNIGAAGGQWALPSAQPWGDVAAVLGPVLGSQHEKDTDLLDWCHQRATKMIEGWSICCGKRGDWEPQEEEAQGDLTNLTRGSR